VRKIDGFHGLSSSSQSRRPHTQRKLNSGHDNTARRNDCTAIDRAMDAIKQQMSGVDLDGTGISLLQDAANRSNDRRTLGMSSMTKRGGFSHMLYESKYGTSDATRDSLYGTVTNRRSTSGLNGSEDGRISAADRAVSWRRTTDIVPTTSPRPQPAKGNDNNETTVSTVSADNTKEPMKQDTSFAHQSSSQDASHSTTHAPSSETNMSSAKHDQSPDVLETVADQSTPKDESSAMNTGAATATETDTPVKSIVPAYRPPALRKAQLNTQTLETGSCGDSSLKSTESQAQTDSEVQDTASSSTDAQTVQVSSTPAPEIVSTPEPAPEVEETLTTMLEEQCTIEKSCPTTDEPTDSHVAEEDYIDDATLVSTQTVDHAEHHEDTVESCSPTHSEEKSEFLEGASNERDGDSTTGNEEASLVDGDTTSTADTEGSVNTGKKIRRGRRSRKKQDKGKSLEAAGHAIAPTLSNDSTCMEDTHADLEAHIMSGSNNEESSDKSVVLSNEDNEVTEAVASAAMTASSSSSSEQRHGRRRDRRKANRRKLPATESQGK
jgi:hypothetical protein